MPVSIAAPGPEMRLGTTEELEAAAAAGGDLNLGALDFTTEQLSLAGIEKELEAFGDSEVLRAILDQGGYRRGGGHAILAGATGPDHGVDDSRGPCL